MDRIRIINWSEYQHYKDRCSPWIKLHSNLFEKYEFRCLHDASKMLLISLWLLRSRLDGDIPNDSAYIKQVTSFKGKVDLKPLIDAGFIECLHDASIEQANVTIETAVCRASDQATQRAEICKFQGGSP